MFFWPKKISMMSGVDNISSFSSVSTSRCERRGIRVEFRHVGKRVTMDMAYNAKVFWKCAKNWANLLGNRFVLLFSVHFGERGQRKSSVKRRNWSRDGS